MIKAKAIAVRKFNPGVFEDEAYAAAKKVLDGMHKDFQRFVEPWEHQPKFKKNISPKASAVWELSVTTDDEIFGYVDKGTKKHKIRARPGGVLAFGSKFKPKTKPKTIASVPGFAGGDTVFAKEVQHPGTKARRISREIALTWIPKIAVALAEAVRQGAKKSGHRKT